MISSTAVGSSAGSARSRASCAGLRKSAHHPFPVTFTVASWPAFSRSTQVPIELVLRQALPVVHHERQLADEVARRVSPPSRDSARRYSENSTQARTATRSSSGDGMELVHAADVGGPGTEEAAVGRRDPEQLRDHGNGQRFGDGGDQIERARALDGIHETVHQPLDRRTHALDHARGERLRDETPHPRVVGGSMSRMPCSMRCQNGAAQGRPGVGPSPRRSPRGGRCARAAGRATARSRPHVVPPASGRWRHRDAVALVSAGARTRGTDRR